MKLFWLLIFLSACTNLPKQVATHDAGYPTHWFEPLKGVESHWWEITPDKALPGEVILSKRNELGILSNFAPTPFTYRGKKYASVEGFWQMMKFPERTVQGRVDPRSKVRFPHTREKVAKMVGLEAKFAGDAAEKIMHQLKLDWVSFEGKKMVYCQEEKGEHYRIIREAMIEKMKQNEKVRDILLSTGELKLRADHIEEGCKAPEWKYYQLWMDIRDDLRSQRL